MKAKINTKYLIVGGGPAGVAAIEGIRRHDPEGEIVLLDEQGEPLYSKINMHFLLDKKMTAQNLYLKKTDFYEQNKVKLVREKVENLEAYEYEKLILAYGGKPKTLDVEGKNLKGIYTFYSLKEAEALSGQIESANDIVLVGGGFITLDVLDSLQKTGKNIHLVLRSGEILSKKIGPVGGAMIRSNIADRVKFYFNSEIKSFEGSERVKSAVLNNGEEIKCDLVILAIGIEPDLTLANALGVQVNRAIVVDEHFRTSKENVYAAGDICEIIDRVSGEPMMAGNWLFALESGRLAGENAAGANLVNNCVPIVVKNLLGLNLLFVGNITDKFEKREFIQENRYFCAYLKDEILVGVSAINLSEKLGMFRKNLGQKFELDEKAIFA